MIFPSRAGRSRSRSLLAFAALSFAAAASCSEDDPGTGGAEAATSSSSTTASTGSGGDGTGNGGTGGAGTGAGGTGGGGDLSLLSDTFDGAALDSSWTVYNPDLVDVSVADGSLSLQPNQLILWYQASEGVLAYKLVKGDFKVTSTVRARKVSTPADPPDDYVHLGGLMARSPASDGVDAAEDYVFIVLGNDENDLSVETKITEGSLSEYDGPPWPSGDAELRICRVGATFNLYKRPVGAAVWEEAASFEANLPDELQVGPNVYAATAAPDLQVSFSEVVFAAVTAGSDCTQD